MFDWAGMIQQEKAIREKRERGGRKFKFKRIKEHKDLRDYTQKQQTGTENEGGRPQTHVPHNLFASIVFLM